MKKTYSEKRKSTERMTLYSVSRACKESIHLNALTFGNGEKYLQGGHNLEHLSASKSQKRMTRDFIEKQGAWIWFRNKLGGIRSISFTLSLNHKEWITCGTNEFCCKTIGGANIWFTDVTWWWWHRFLQTGQSSSWYWGCGRGEGGEWCLTWVGSWWERLQCKCAQQAALNMQLRHCTG